MTTFIKKNIFEIILSLLIGSYIILFSYLSIHRYLSLNSYYFDLGIMDQVVYNTSKGRFLEMTNQDFNKNMSRFAVHFDPILALMVPFYWIYSGPETLLIIQTVILGLGALAVYLIAKNILKNKFYSIMFAIFYLLYFPVQRANLFDFHPVTLATTFLLFMIYFSLIKKNGLSFLFFILSLLTKENIGLITFLWGIYLIFRKKEIKFGLIVSLISVVFFVGALFFIIPYFRQGVHFAAKYFGDYGDSPSKIFPGLLRSPNIVIKSLFSTPSLDYFKQLFLPHLVFIIFAPLEFLIASPDVLINTLSSNPNMRAIYFHYNSLIVVFVIFASIKGFSYIVKKNKNIFLQVGLVLIFIFLNIINIYLYDPLPLHLLKRDYEISSLNNNRLQLIKDWQNKLKDEQIKISTTPKLAPFFTNRIFYHNFLFDSAYRSMGYSDNDIIKTIDDYKAVDYVVIYKPEVINVGKGKLQEKFYQRLRDDRSFKLIFADEQAKIEVYEKVDLLAS